MKKRTAALLCSCALLVGIVINGSMAWLTSQSDQVINTFTVGDINIALQEHKLNPDGHTLSETELTDTTKEDGNDYQFVPGEVLPKDPFVTVLPNSEACVLVVRVIEENNSLLSDGVILYDVFTTSVTDEDGNRGFWTEVPEHRGYYYQYVDKETAETGYKWNILLENQVRVSEDVTKEMVHTLQTNQPKLIFKAAAVQYEHLADSGDWDAIWANLPSGFTDN